MQAQEIPLDIESVSDPNELLPDSTVNVLITSIGYLAAHRAYTSASPLGVITPGGFDLGIEVTLVKLPDEFSTSLESAGVSADSIPPSVPVPKLHVQKGFGRVDLGFSMIRYKSYKIYGGHAQINIYQPEEGPGYALRLGYATSEIGYISTKTWSPAVVMSKKLHFVEPYLGMGYHMTRGTLEISVDVDSLLPENIPSEFSDAVAGETITVSKSSQDNSFTAFMGIVMMTGPLGLKIVIEGAYARSGSHTLGVKAGLAF